MEKLINSVGLSWLYDQIKLDLVNIYNLLNSFNKHDIEHAYDEVDKKICQIAKTFFMLDITGGVFLVNEFRLTLKSLVTNKADRNHIAQLADNIEQILSYIEDIIQGYGDLPIYYVTTIDKLRELRHEVLFSQCSYVVNSVKQNNISDFPSDFTEQQKEVINNSLLFLVRNVEKLDDKTELEQAIKHINNLKREFQGTQHYLLWSLIHNYFELYKNYQYRDVQIFNKIFFEVLDNYNVINNYDFEKLARKTSNWIASLSFSLLFSGYFNILDKQLKTTISKILNIHEQKSLTNYMAFAEQVIQYDSCIILLDIASELDIAISQLDESRHKRRVDINWLNQLMQRHIDSCVLTGTYEPLEYYYEAVKNIGQYTMAGGVISVDDLDTIESHLIKLAENIENSSDTTKHTNNIDHEAYEVFEQYSLAEVNLDAKETLLSQQISELEEISSYVLLEPKLTYDYIKQSFHKITNILKIIGFESGEQIINLYLSRLEQTTELENILSDSLRQNVIVFIKYLTEIIKAIYKDQDYNFHLKSLKNLINNIELAGINNQRPELSKLDASNELNQEADNQESIFKTSETTKKSNSTSLQEIFFEEYEELQHSISTLLQAWRQNPYDATTIEALQRELHTLKGASRMVSFLVISEWVHHIEEVLTKLYLQPGLINNSHVTKISAACDKLNELVSAYKINITPQLPALLDLSFAPQPMSNEPEVSVASLLNTGQVTKPRIRLSADGTIKEEALNRVDNNTNLRTIPLRQNVRVSKDEIDALLDSACELVIGQHQLSQQNTNLSSVVSSFKTVLENINTKIDSGTNISTSKIARELHQLNSIVKVLYELRSNYYNLVDENETNVNATFNNLVDLRMVPLSAIRERIEQLVSTIAADLNKSIKFTIRRSEGSIDRVVLEQITPSIEHLVRNAIAHGIELADIRRIQGKPKDGILELNMYTSEQTVIIEIADDGQGIDSEKIKQQALALDIIDINQDVNEHNLLPIITSPNFSTEDTVSQISGRGIGLNVVKETVSQLCGTLELKTSPGLGCKFTIKLPCSMTKQSLLFVKIADLYYAIPSLIVDEVLQVNSDDIEHTEQGYFYSEMQVYSLYDLLNADYNKSLDIKSDYTANQSTTNVVIINYKNTKIGCIVDDTCETREVVVRPLSTQLRKLTEFMGGTIYQDGRVVLILDLITIIEKSITKSIPESMNQHGMSSSFNSSSHSKYGVIDTREPIRVDFDTKYKPNISVSTNSQIEHDNAADLGLDLDADSEVVKQFERKTTVLVIDDSATVRHAIKNYLTPANYSIITATDGKDGLEKLCEIKPDLILLDIIMPNMNGIEFLAKIRKTAEFKSIPVIIMSSRSDENYKEAARSLNVDVYIKKPYDQKKLVNAINYVMEA